MSLTHRVFSDAFRDMQRAMSVFEQPFFNSPRFFDYNKGSRYPVSDMAETSDSYDISAEIPGYDKSNVKIELVDHRTLVLSGSMVEQHETQPKDQMQESGEQQVVRKSDAPQYWVKERVAGSFSRSFTFPKPVNPDAIKASFENGVLKVSVPKKNENQARQITIE